MGRAYTIVYSGTLTNAGGDSDLFTILPADDKMVQLAGLDLGQSSEVGDAQEEELRISIIRLPATVTNGSGGASVTPQVPDSHTAAVAFTARANDTTLATTSGTAVTVVETSWNVRVPTEKWWPEEKFRPTVYQGEALVVRCNQTPADDITINITAYLEEF